VYYQSKALANFTKKLCIEETTDDSLEGFLGADLCHLIKDLDYDQLV